MGTSIKPLDPRRHYAVAVNGLKMTYECPEGHRYVINHGVGPIYKQLSEWWLRKMLSYWSRENGGVQVRQGVCPTCRKSKA